MVGTWWLVLGRSTKAELGEVFKLRGHQNENKDKDANADADAGEGEMTEMQMQMEGEMGRVRVVRGYRCRLRADSIQGTEHNYYYSITSSMMMMMNANNSEPTGQFQFHPQHE